MKVKITLFVFSFFCFSVSCRYFTKQNHNKFETLYTDEFKGMIRKEQIRKCGECHRKEYENEMLGPHSVAFKKLTDHRAFVNHPAYTCDFYTKHVNDKYDVDCMRCHATENLFEGLLKKYQDADSLINTLLNYKYPPLVERKKTADRETGVDCMTCHFDGNGVLSNNEKFRQPSSAPCNPKFTLLYKNTDITCYPCHSEEYKSLGAFNSENSLPGKECLSCHMESDANGKGTHYYFWYLDQPNKKNIAYAKMMEGFKFEKSSGNSISYIVCMNNFLPHKIGLCPELILNFEIMDKDSIVLGKTSLRLNRKTEFDASMYDYFGKKYLGGVNGIEPPLAGSSAKYPIRVSHGDKARLMKINVIKKQQYWFPDSLGVETLSRTIKVN